MRMNSVVPLNFEGAGGGYDLAIFASGFEARATNILKLTSVRPRSCRVLGFSNDRETLSRKTNDQVFSDAGWAVDIVPETEADQYIYEMLNHAHSSCDSRETRILVDYSVMTRAWYGAILNWAAALDDGTAVQIDFAYSHGDYARKFGPLKIEDIVSLSGFEGISSGARSTTAFFGLGFDKYATLSVLDRIEPDDVYCFVARSGDSADSADYVLSENSEVVDAAQGKVFSLPIASVAESFRIICEHVSIIEDDPSQRDTEIAIVPMGPKPHVLASLLAAQRMPRVACLHVKGERAEPVEVKATGIVTACRVEFVNDFARSDA